MRALTLFIGSILALMSAVTSQSAERVALVVGNSDYRHVSSLPNPANDARDISASLERLGFQVTNLNDAGFDGMRRALQEFSTQASNAEMAVVFYAGHGMEVNKQNYLVPTDAKLETDRDISFEAVPLDLVTEAVSGAKALKLVILDACRNNPFSASMKRTLATRSIGRGLARMEPGAGTLVTFAAKEGTVALDGDGRNSPYTRALLKHLETPGLEIQFLFREVRDFVMQETDGEQQPFTYGSLGSGRIYLNGAAPQTTGGNSDQTTNKNDTKPVPGSNRDTIDLAFWDAVKDSGESSMLKEYLNKFPDGNFATLAKLKLAKLAPVVNQTDTRTSSNTNNGEASATVVQFAQGSFELNTKGEWQEFGSDPYTVRFTFKETSRDKTSIYGLDASRNMKIQFDLSRRWIRLGDVNGPWHDSYPITDHSAKLNGRQTAFVAMQNGTFKQEGRIWKEFDASGKHTHTFTETVRDMWSVYARDEGRKMDLQFDLHRKVIRLAWPGKPMFDWTTIKDAR